MPDVHSDENAVERDAERIVRALEQARVPALLVGAVAVRAHLAEPWRRPTNDVDLVVPKDAEQATRSVLTGLGYRYYAMGPWRRAEREGSRIDVAFGEVVDMASYVSFPLAFGAAVERSLSGAGLPVATVEEVVVMKLIAHRDKDLLDVVALLHEVRLDAARFRKLVFDADVEIAVRRGALELVAGVELGFLKKLWAERTDQTLEPGDWHEVTVGVRATLGD